MRTRWLLTRAQENIADESLSSANRADFLRSVHTFSLQRSVMLAGGHHGPVAGRQAKMPFPALRIEPEHGQASPNDRLQPLHGRMKDYTVFAGDIGFRHGPVERAEIRPSLLASSRLAMLVPSESAVYINKRPAGFPQPPAKVVVLIVKKNALIESAEAKERFPPAKHGGAGHGLDAAVASRTMFWFALIVGGRTKNRGVLKDDVSIRLEKPWRESGGARVVLRCLGQSGDRTGLEADVRVHEKDEISRSCLSAAIAGASIAYILRKGQDADRIIPSHTDRVVAAGVINNDDLNAIRQPAETFAQDVAAIVAHDDNADSRIF